MKKVVKAFISEDKKDYKVFFDMDGVLADFDRGCKELLDVTPRKQGNHAKFDDMLFEKIREYKNFYKELKPVDGSIKLLKDVVDSLGSGRVEILTGVPKPSRGIEEASDNKREWVKKYIGSSIKVNCVLRKDKVKYIDGDSSILIDDYINNIKDWNKSGGTGILFNSADQVRKDLENMGIL